MKKGNRRGENKNKSKKYPFRLDLLKSSGSWLIISYYYYECLFTKKSKYFLLKLMLTINDCWHFLKQTK